MYERFFRFSERPFAVLPDSRRIFWTDGHRNAFSVLEVGFQRLSQVTVLTGDIGTGKTTLIRHLLQTTSDAFSVGLLSNFSGERCDLLSWVLSAFGLDVSGHSEAVKFRRLETFLEGESHRGRRSVLIVDEAQNLSERDFESLRLLSNINADDVLLMLVLVGQPQLRAKLTHVGNQRLCQRIGADYNLGPLSQQETADFVRYRCIQAGGSPTLFDDEALIDVYSISGGVPRKINVLCDLALVSAFAEGVRQVDNRIVRSVVADARRHGTYMSLTESDVMAGCDAALGTATKPVSSADDSATEPVSTLGDTARDQVQRLTPMLGPGSDAPEREKAPLHETEGEHAPAAPLGPAPPTLSVRADPGGLDTLFGTAWPDDALDLLNEIAGKGAAPAPQGEPPATPSRGEGLPEGSTLHGEPPAAPSPGERPPQGARHSPVKDDAADRSEPAPCLAGDADDDAIWPAAAGAETILQDSPAPHPASPAASACPPSRAELALRQAFNPQPGRRRIGWRGAAVFAAGSSMAASIAIALLPTGAPSVTEPARDARPAEPERITLTEAPLSVVAVQGATADPAPTRGDVAGISARDGSPVVSDMAVEQDPSITRDWEAFTPVALRHEDPHIDSIAATAPPATSFPKPQPVRPGARLAGAVADHPGMSLPQRNAAERRPSHPGQPRALSTPGAAADVFPSIALPYGNGGLPPSREDASALAASGQLHPASRAMQIARAGHAPAHGLEGAVPAGGRAPRDIAAASGTETADTSPAPSAAPGRASDPRPARKVDLASASLASGSPANAPRPVPRFIATTSASTESDPDAIFRHALDVAVEDSRAAVIGYARAALLGHERAAYYLGQIYETGDGVPVDFAIARHWYEAASDGNPRAENRLADLPAPQDGRIAAPLPLLAQPLDAAQADFVWSSGEGADPASYVVEISSDPAVGADAAYSVTGSAARLPVVQGATHWRVLALDATGKQGAASDWLALALAGSDRSAAAETPPDHL